MKKRGYMGKFLGGGFASIVGLCALASPAQAESVVFVLDQSGSMARAGVSGDIANGVRWDDAIAAARSWAEQYRGTADEQHEITVWGFKDDGAEQLWPRDAADCAAVFGTLMDVTGDEGTPIGTTCMMSDSEDDWLPFINAFGLGGAIYETHPPIDGGPQTPLAEGLCTAISAINNLEGVKSVILEADGNENNSDGPCMGTPSNANTGFPSATQADWGYPTSGWEARTLRRVVRFPGTAQQAIYGGLSEDQVDLSALVIPPPASASQAARNSSEWCGFYGSGDPAGLCSNTLSVDDSMHWKVDLHYSLCPVAGQECAEFTRPDHWLDSEPLMARSFNLISANTGPSNDSAGGVMALSRLSTSATLMSSVYPSIPDEEFLLLETFANSTSEGSLRTFVRGDGTTYGMAHALAGDVDDSGCADQADLSIIMQSDVWLKRAVAPLQIAIRADLNRDGWVNEFDKAVLLAPENWGEGCANPPAHPEGGPSCHNNVLDGNETDTDCGGDACGLCAAKAVCEEDSECVSGDCEGARCVATTSCTASNAIDLGAPGAPKTVANNACVKLQKGLPSWWGTSRKVLLQTNGGGTYPIPYHWENSCKSTQGSGTFSGNWQSRTFGPTSKSCATVIKLDGTGGNVKLVYYGQ